MVDIAAFLTARLDEREAVARAVDDNSPPFDGQWKNDNNRALRTYNDWVLAYKPNADPWPTGVLDHIAANDPAHVLADIAAKRAIVEDYQVVVANNAIDEAAQSDEVRSAARDLVIKSLRVVLLHLASADAEHPDYDESWRP